MEKKSTTCVLIVVISTSAPTPAPITPTPSPTPAQTPASILSPTPAPRAPLTCSEQNKKDFYGNCVDICPVNSKLNNDGMKCECPNEYSLPNIDNSDCEMFLTAEYDHLSKLNILQISQNQIIHFEDLAMEQVRLMRNNTIPLNENYLDSLDFALVLEV